jgi:histidine triad (HIT) family protein
MSLDGVYDGNNIFARIVRGEIPAARIFEDEHTLAFLDAFPQSRGHTLVIHRASTARNLLELEPLALASVMATVQKVARALHRALNPDGLWVSQFNGAAAGQTVFHYHVHIIPRWRDAPLGRHGAGAMAEMADLSILAGQISARLEA